VEKRDEQGERKEKKYRKCMRERVGMKNWNCESEEIVRGRERDRE